MGTQATILFVDLQGSTAVYEALGNLRATQIVTDMVQQLVQQAASSGGRVIKTLGDGVLVLFPQSPAAIHAAVQMQRSHQKRLLDVEQALQLPLRIGIAAGDIEIISGDCYGDAVNIASRLCDLCGPHQIWIQSAALNRADEGRGVSFRLLGPIHVRGRVEPCSVHQIEWREEDHSALLTMLADDAIAHLPHQTDFLGRHIELSYLHNTRSFKVFDLPAYIGRAPLMEFVVNDLRVSRSHARLEWHHGSIQLVDVSSFGSWLRFNGDLGSELFLRRDRAVLHGHGELALGTSFSDPTAPIVRFHVS